MKSLVELIDFRYILGKKQRWLDVYILVYLLYAFTTGLEDPLLATSMGIFIFAPLLPSFLMFVFFLLWEDVTVFSFGLTSIMVMQIIMVAKIIIANKLYVSKRNKLQSKLYSIQTLLTIYVCIMGILSYIVGDGLTGLGLVFKLLISFYIISFVNSDHVFETLLKSMLHVLMISAIVATVYGLFHDTGVDRWIAELGHTSNQLSGTVGTTRMALFYLVAVSFFLYYVKNTLVRYWGVISFCVLIIMTISLTAIILTLMVFLVYMFSLDKINKSLIGVTLFLFAGLVSFPIWSQLDVVKPVVYRATDALYAYESGDVNLAVSGRQKLSENYMKNWSESSMSNKYFGYAKSARSVTGIFKFSHNTYIDMLFYFGLMGVLFFAILLLIKLKSLRYKPYFFPLLTMKMVYIVGSATVSIMTTAYYFIIIFI
jgi:hypothetical protein